MTFTGEHGPESERKMVEVFGHCLDEYDLSGSAEKVMGALMKALDVIPAEYRDTAYICTSLGGV